MMAKGRKLSKASERDFMRFNGLTFISWFLERRFIAGEMCLNNYVSLKED
jgi:hypothetical protein